MQPPSGGCVLKPKHAGISQEQYSAAFGRLCVETAKAHAPAGGGGGSRLRAAVC